MEGNEQDYDFEPYFNKIGGSKELPDLVITWSNAGITFSKAMRTQFAGMNWMLFFDRAKGALGLCPVAPGTQGSLKVSSAGMMASTRFRAQFGLRVAKKPIHLQLERLDSGMYVAQLPAELWLPEGRDGD